jgi:hypothetical protein
MLASVQKNKLSTICTVHVALFELRVCSAIAQTMKRMGGGVRPRRRRFSERFH